MGGVDRGLFGYAFVMTKNETKDLTRTLRARGLRKKLAKQIGQLEGNRRREGAEGEDMARQTAKDLEVAASEIRERVLAGDPKRRAAGRKAAETRKRNAAKRRASARRGANTRSKVAKVREKASK